jgi:5-methylcytosine-specific restriction endonuclease McrA
VSAFVLDNDRKPLDPCHPARARELLSKGRAAVFRRFPFTIILNDRSAEPATVHEHRIKIDPGSKVTGVAVVQQETARVVVAIEIEHRGGAIRAHLEARRAIRRSRRARKTRYRPPRSDHRTRRTGWLPPSLESRVANILTWVARIGRSCPTAAISQELVRFDTQAMEDPQIGGVAYQQGTLAGYELREYLLEKWGRKCAYCDKDGVPLQVEHIRPKSRGGTDRASNLTIACEPCNRRKGNRPVEDFLAAQPERLRRIAAQAQAPLKDAAAINATRWELYRRLQATGRPVECGSGGRTKFNRTRLGFPKAHWLDAACVGPSTPEDLDAAGVRPILIKACGHGRRNRCWTDRQGFPIRHAPRKKYDRGFRTGDLVEANVPSGKYCGRHAGRVAIRFGQNFQVGAASVHPRNLRKLHSADGYAYSFGETFLSSSVGGAALPHAGRQGFPPRRI